MVRTAASILPSRYRDAERIARGAMGEVYRATDSSLGRVVAVKVLSAPSVGDEAARRRFAREARAAARVSDDRNIVTIYDVGEAGDTPYIVMEYMPRGSLEQRLAAEGAQPAATALRWLEQTAHALDNAHERGVVHRDVKPGNLLLDDADEIHVADFGIASAAGTPSLTVTGTVLGTAGYLSPEQARGERASPASDRYALAVVAYELLSGERPFASDSPAAEAAAHANAPVPSISARAALPAGLDGVFRRALAKDPRERYPTCADFVAALRAAFESEAGSTPTLPLAPRAPVTQATRPMRVRRRAPRWPLTVAALGAVVLLGVVLAVALPGSPEKKRPRRAAHTAAKTPLTTASATTASTPPTTSSAPTTTPASAPAAAGPHALNDQAWELIKRGRYSEALPLLEQAVPALRGTGPSDPAEGYANYNLGYTLLQLGRCPEAKPYLEQARRLEPDRPEVRSALDQLKQCTQPAKGAGKGKPKHH